MADESKRREIQRWMLKYVNERDWRSNKGEMVYYVKTHLLGLSETETTPEWVLTLAQEVFEELEEVRILVGATKGRKKEE